jgi:NAD(P)-dependent dehydrogenase (short-subunit alcohol dehydrogenase family)
MASIIITGSNGNLGLAVVNRLIKDGYHLLAASGKDGAGNLPDDKNLITTEVDLLDEDKAHQFAESCMQKHNDIQAAVLLVGGFAMGNLTVTDKAGLQEMIDLNFYSAFHLVRPLLRHFLSRPEGGQFILIGSRPGLNAADGKDFFAYSLSKAMIFKLAEFINVEGKDKGVTATVIVPSTIDTETNRKAMPDADFSKWVPAENIADAISFSLSGTGKMLRENVVKIYNRS